MQHLDEGTIHSWLDGALSADEAGSVEAHVADCSACAEMVAEARGLIAGSSRILTALDHVPGGVIPGGAPAAPIPAQRSVRRWASRPALRAAAAVLFLAGASLVVLSRIGIDGAGDMTPALERAEPAPVEAATLRVEEQADATLGATGQGAAAPPRAETPRSDVAGAFRGSAAASARAPAEEPQPQRFQPPPPQAKTAIGAAGAPAPTAPTARDALSGRVAGVQVVPPGGDSGRQPLTAADSLAELRRRQMMSAPMRLEQIVTTSVSAIAQDSLRGRALQAERREQANVVTGAEAQSAAPVIARPGVEMAGCYSVMIGNWRGAGARAAAVVPTLLRLEATTLDIAREGPRLVLRAATDTAALRPDSSYWRVSAPDSLLVVWKGALPEVTLRLAIRDPLLEGNARQGDLTAPVTARRVGAVCGERQQDER